ncbi:MAG TPA: hypothetical protein VMS98_05840 [Thermoanaerobaculia bacterium]|nr:hypothetical protein [Thermoanaerobaculia bacterium]
MPYERHEFLSRSESGIHYVRDRRSGILRRLTEEELRDLSDPPPCVECGEQFGCAHINCAREPMMAEGEVESEVPPEWLAFAREHGVSRNDVDRLRAIVSVAGEYAVAPGHSPDMRTLEMMLLLNESR